MLEVKYVILCNVSTIVLVILQVCMSSFFNYNSLVRLLLSTTFRKTSVRLNLSQRSVSQFALLDLNKRNNSCKILLQDGSWFKEGIVCI